MDMRQARKPGLVYSMLGWVGVPSERSEPNTKCILGALSETWGARQWVGGGGGR